MPPRMSLGKKILCVFGLCLLFITILFAEFFQISVPAFVLFLVIVFILGSINK